MRTRQKFGERLFFAHQVVVRILRHPIMIKDEGALLIDRQIPSTLTDLAYICLCNTPSVSAMSGVLGPGLPAVSGVGQCTFLVTTIFNQDPGKVVGGRSKSGLTRSLFIWP
jgi:hypothetical protein